jgi:hypothetical protein
VSFLPLPVKLTLKGAEEAIEHAQREQKNYGKEVSCWCCGGPVRKPKGNTGTRGKGR